MLCSPPVRDIVPHFQIDSYRFTLVQIVQVSLTTWLEPHLDVRPELRVVDVHAHRPLHGSVAEPEAKDLVVVVRGEGVQLATHAAHRLEHALTFCLSRMHIHLSQRSIPISFIMRGRFRSDQ
jgi:hypothetical protein